MSKRNGTLITLISLSSYFISIFHLSVRTDKNPMFKKLRPQVLESDSPEIVSHKTVSLDKYLRLNEPLIFHMQSRGNSTLAYKCVLMIKTLVSFLALRKTQ